MTFKQDLENQININLILIDARFNALKSTLDETALKKYEESMADYKKEIQEKLVKILSAEQFDALLKAFDE